MSVILPPELQQMIFTYLMYSSAKGLELKKQVQEGWFKLGLKRLSRALDTESQDMYHQELVHLLLSIDELPCLPADMRFRFHAEMLKLHFDRHNGIEKARVWIVKLQSVSLEKLHRISTSSADVKYFLNGVIFDRNKLYGYLYLEEETRPEDIVSLLCSWEDQCATIEAPYYIKAAGVNRYSVASEFMRYINRPDSYIVAFGKYRPNQPDPQIVLKFPSRESNYLLI